MFYPRMFRIAISTMGVMTALAALQSSVAAVNVFEIDATR